MNEYTGVFLGEKKNRLNKSLMVDSEIAVINSVLSGNTDAFEHLVNKYQARIYSTVLNYVLNPEDAVDVTQEAFLKAYRNLNRFKSGSAFYTWLYRIAINCSIDFIRKKKIKPAESLDDDKYSQVGFEPVSKDENADPEHALNKSEQEKILRSAIAKLSPKLKDVIVLHDIEGLSQEEIAQIIRIPVGTVKSRISRARNELKEILKDKFGELI